MLAFASFIFLEDLYRGEPGDEEPSWVENERDSFRTYRDKDGDGKLNHDEVDYLTYSMSLCKIFFLYLNLHILLYFQVKQWILPDDYDHAEAESNHLIHNSDANGDGKLSKEEVLDKYDVFVGSQATDFGEALVKHDEF